MNSTTTKYIAYKSKHIAYSSEQGIALKVSYRSTPAANARLYLRWMRVISFQDALSISEGLKEISMADSNPVSAMEMGEDTVWDCLLMTKM